MSTILEIEKAIGQLPPAQWTQIRQWMDSHAPKAVPSARVDWSESAAVRRSRAAETWLPAAVVMAALAADMI